MKHMTCFEIRSLLTEPPAGAAGNEEPARSPVFASVNGYAQSSIESERPPVPVVLSRRRHHHTNQGAVECSISRALQKLSAA